MAFIHPPLIFPFIYPLPPFSSLSSLSSPSFCCLFRFSSSSFCTLLYTPSTHTISTYLSIYHLYLYSYLYSSLSLSVPCLPLSLSPSPPQVSSSSVSLNDSVQAGLLQCEVAYEKQTDYLSIVHKLQGQLDELLGLLVEVPFWSNSDLSLHTLAATTEQHDWYR